MSIKMAKRLGWRRYTLHLVAKALHLHAKIENGQPIGAEKESKADSELETFSIKDGDDQDD